MRKNLFLITAMCFFIFSHTLTGQCNLVTYVLPMGEFSTSKPWYFEASDPEDQWQGATNYYDMFDPCVVEANTLVITEVNIAEGDSGTYVELTNVGETDVNLSQYRLVGFRESSGSVIRMSHINLSGSLAGGESYVVMGYRQETNEDKGIGNRNDIINIHNKELAKIASLKVAVDKRKNAYPFCVGRTIDVLGSFDGYNLALVKKSGDTAEVIVDVFELTTMHNGVATIATVWGAAATHTIVRKQFTGGRTYGNVDFSISAGEEAAEASEWIVLPRFRNGTTHLPSTIGSHNPNSKFSVTAKNGLGAKVFDNTSVITVPWGVYRGDSIISYLNVGEDMSWEYHTNGDNQKDRSNLVQNGDIITFYHCGVDVTVKSYHIQVDDPLTTNTQLVSKNRRSDLSRMFYETTGLPVDTIYGSRLTYNYPVDSLLEHIEIAEGSEISMIWIAGNERSELKTGDVVRVLSPDKTTSHDYYIALEDYQDKALSDDASLTVIRWPDCKDKDLDFQNLWVNGDTIPVFNKDVYYYVIKLPAGTVKVPALSAVPSNYGAIITENPATDLFGSISEQITTFKVTAEDEISTAVYKVRFVVETEDFEYEAEPFISEIAYNNSFSVLMEICNPGNKELDLSDYVIVHGMYNNKTLESALMFNNRSFWYNAKVYRPGYSYDSLAMVVKEKYYFYSYPDNMINPVVKPGGVFTIGTTRADGSSWGKLNPITGKWAAGAENDLVEGPDIILHGHDDTKDWGYNKYAGWGGGLMGRIIYGAGKTQGQSNTFWLLKIVNENVKNGKAGLNATDVEVIDVVGKEDFSYTHGWLNPFTGKPFFPTDYNSVLQRNPDVYKGNSVSMGSFGYAGIETPEDYDPDNPLLGDTTAFEWNFFTTQKSNFSIGYHTLNPVTFYKAQVNSSVYEVSLGVSMNETISGVPAGTNVGSFMTNIVKLDEGQKLKVTSSTGSMKFDWDVVQNGDILEVISADGVNQIEYKISTGELNSDTSLSSNLYQVTNTSVELPSLDITLKELISNLEVASSSILYIVDEHDGLVPLLFTDPSNSTYQDRYISEDISLKVVAQSGDSKMYELDLPTTVEDAIVTSSYYMVNQDDMLISGVYNGTNIKSILYYLKGNDGAEVSVVDKWGVPKKITHVFSSDVVKVVSADGSNTKYYGINLDTELESEIILDIDNDGLGANEDTDDDNDGILDELDQLPFNPYESEDADGDGIGDNADDDDDNDSVSDYDDAFPFNPEESSDADSDGVGDNEDQDDDNDNVSDEDDLFPLDASESKDYDNDGVGDNADKDDDNDGLPDDSDSYPFDTDNNGVDNTIDNDDDGDAVLDEDDKFPLDASEASDNDNDGIGDNADTDDDNDGVLDSDDVFPFDASEINDNDGDGVGDNADNDDDNDNVLDNADAFPFDSSESLDTDNDGLGDNKDTDDDGDGVSDAEDAFPLDAAETADSDNDGTGDNADNDDDNDSYSDMDERFNNTDPFDAESVPSDNDNDGISDLIDDDDDNDGIKDSDDSTPWGNESGVNGDEVLDVSIIPTVTDKNVVVSFESELQFDILLFDIKGKLVQQICNIDKTQEVNMNNLSAGVYIIKVRQDTRIIAQSKVIKE